MKKRISLLTAIFGLLVLLSSAQSYGELRGKVFDEFGEPMPYANILVQQGNKTLGCSSDLDGKYKLKPLAAGKYSLKFSFIGYDSLQLDNVNVNPDEITFVPDVKLQPASFLIGAPVVVVHVRDPLINPEETSKITIRAAEISKSPMAKNPIGLIASMSSEISQKPDSDELYFRGSRGGSTVFFIDGVKSLRGVGRFPGGAIGSVSVYTGGLPAKYGDTTGGVVVIETRNYFDLYNEHQSRQ